MLKLTDVRVFCMQMRADTMKMDEAKGESLEREEGQGQNLGECLHIG